MLSVVMHIFLAPPLNFYIHALKLFSANSVNPKLETHVACARCPGDYHADVQSSTDVIQISSMSTQHFDSDILRTVIIKLVLGFNIQQQK
jgi:hypothetical protein